jgi:branched-chain amino acid transport system ATP-binding protein
MTITAQPMFETSARPTVGSRVVLHAQGLRKSFGGQRVLDELDLLLHEGEVVLLRGENGSGKTTLLNILTGNLEPDAGTIEYLADGSPRTCRFPRSWIGNLNPFDHFTPEFVAREGLGRTWQDVRLFGSHSLRDNIAVADSRNPGENPLIALCAPGRTDRHEAEICQRADNMLAQLGLAGREDSSGDMISLGQSKRVAIARAVAGGARILFLDEPLAGLDRQGITDILQLLETLVKERRLTLVIVEHVFNFTHLHHLVNVHWAIAGGRIVRDIAKPIPQVLRQAAQGLPSTIPRRIRE